MTDTPLVTIGLPVYNSERFIEQSLDSLLAQTYSDFVLIINDNASTDGTARICQRYVEADSRVQYFCNQQNIGNPRNFNRIFELTKTKYLKWSTSDDFWEPTFLERALEIMEQDESVALCYPKTYLVEADGLNPVPYEDDLHLVQEDPAERFLMVLESIKLAHQHLGVIRTSYLRQTHLLGTHVASDINLLAEIALYGKIYELPERLFYRRFHPKSGSWKRGDMAHDAELYKAADASHIDLRLLYRLWGHFQAVSASPIGMRSKLRIYARLLRRAIWNREHLMAELVNVARGVVAGLGSSQAADE